ncbi:peroxin 26 [Paracoccidioides lutzii Pb01]|uniref:Peroxin 26 n=1 Tax=Paracoccidioides lutzii (strain ATCC MYA-826 / Pb01) TaxID=502779 RepID=C1H719_PARBA|nr:peroxin 26 [Paracoccidioides lutzii Pb01]EEH35513.1 peroxin 26 [Paracoccidioides lutzii Pb01]
MSGDGFSRPSKPPRLSSSSSLSFSSSKQISQAYKQSSQLFLTRRLQESLSVIEPIITPSLSQDGQQDGPAPIATASNSLRKKVWNLYISILNAIVDLGPEEGRKQFGQKEWKALASKVRDGSLWDIVSRVGYGGRDGSIDADVVYNIATLILTHSPSQKLNQQCLENYLSSSGQPDLDIEAHIENSPPGKKKQRASHANGTDTPKDLTARVRILELFTLHVLPQNDEWDYAKEFISLSEVLDDERKEAFLQTLENLREEKEQGLLRSAELQREKEAELERQRQEEQGRLAAEQKAAAEKSLASKLVNGHQRTSSEVDYGIENGVPNVGSSTKNRILKPATKVGRASASTTGRSAAESSKQVKKTGKSKPVIRQMRMLANLLVALVRYIGRSMSANPLSFLRTLLIVFGALLALSRANVRARLRRITDSGWQKIRGTVGMGVKVSYI